MLKKLFYTTIFITLLLPASVAHASQGDNFVESARGTAQTSELPGANTDIDSGVELVGDLVGGFINSFLGFLAIIFFVLMIYGGIMWMSSSGNEDRVNKAKKLITAAIIGLSIVLLSYLITIMVIDIFNTEIDTP